jgi:hypothetical protein
MVKTITSYLPESALQQHKARQQQIEKEKEKQQKS